MRTEEQTHDGTRRLLDIVVGHVVIEVKKDLRRKNVLGLAEDQGAGYVSTRTEQSGTRFIGILSDGALWRLNHLAGDHLAHVAELDISTSRDAERLAAWLETVLATETASNAHPMRSAAGSAQAHQHIDSTTPS